MYEESTCFSAEMSEDCFSQMVSDPALPPPDLTGTATESFQENLGISMENLSYSACGEDATVLTNRVAAATTTEIVHRQQQMGFNVENSYHSGNTHLVEEVKNGSSQGLSFDQSNWDTSMPGGFSCHHHQNHDQDQQFPYPTPDLLNLLYLPSSSTSSFVSSFISFDNPTQKTLNPQNPSAHDGLAGHHPMGADSTNMSSVLHDPFLHLNLPAHPLALRELLQSLPHGYTLPASNNGFIFGGGEDDDREGSGVAYQDGEHGRDFDNGVLKFTQDVASVGRKGGGKRTKQVTTEKQRRVEFSSKFEALRELIPNPTKNDRASVVGDAIGYIRELLRTVKGLKLLVDIKRCGKERIKKRQKVDQEDASGDLESCSLKPTEDQDHPYINGCIRSSWLQRKSKDTEVDVRIIDDEVTIKLVQRKKINCLLYASKVLDELELDLQHVNGGYIGDFCSFFINSKIYEGSSVYASAIANKLIEVLDRNFQAA